MWTESNCIFAFWNVYIICLEIGLLPYTSHCCVSLSFCCTLLLPPSSSRGRANAPNFTATILPLLFSCICMTASSSSSYALPICSSLLKSTEQLPAFCAELCRETDQRPTQAPAPQNGLRANTSASLQAQGTNTLQNNPFVSTISFLRPPTAACLAKPHYCPTTLSRHSYFPSHQSAIPTPPF